MADTGEYRFADASRLCIAQARFEAIRLGSRVIHPAHLVLGVTKAIPQTGFQQLFPEPVRFESLCHSLGADATAAPVSAEDVTYSAAAIAAVAGAHHAATVRPGTVITPLDLLLGVHRPREEPGAASQSPHVTASLALDAAGVTVEALIAILSTGQPDER